MCRSKLSRSSLNYYVNFFAKNNIFNKFYTYLYEKYSDKQKNDKLKYLYTDTSFIINHNCLHEYVERNKYIKNKFSIKLSLLTDVNGIPIDIQFVKGNLHDSPLIEKHFKEVKCNLDSNKYKNVNRHKRYFMAVKNCEQFFSRLR
ncbi:hypothetical protein Hokovirus_1_256 [Hokovirus HKV1]|uniref:Uncharacterized protein n=1 Tax=Hokovirus HKV1 TaxID=1977638 RepID=A0A1V0SF89_9VIRU|nr:hypothetical protein Hokovirus_1_256 [Hokovirus HKV1]